MFLKAQLQKLNNEKKINNTLLINVLRGLILMVYCMRVKL